ncbi:MAG: hypothetical protein AB7S80_06820 [Rhizobiaceae bacterium]
MPPADTRLQASTNAATFVQEPLNTFAKCAGIAGLLPLETEIAAGTFKHRFTADR